VKVSQIGLVFYFFFSLAELSSFVAPGVERGFILNYSIKETRNGICEQTHYRWRKIYGELKVEQAKRLKEIEADQEAGCRTLLA
jgi:hypothetical protein